MKKRHKRVRKRIAIERRATAALTSLSFAAPRCHRGSIDYAAWLAENPAPDLQELVRKYGGYNKITAEAWAEWDRDVEAWRKRYALRAIGESRAK
jgi:hypothetical protein